METRKNWLKKTLISFAILALCIGLIGVALNEHYQLQAAIEYNESLMTQYNALVIEYHKVVSNYSELVSNYLNLTAEYKNLAEQYAALGEHYEALVNSISTAWQFNTNNTIHLTVSQKRNGVIISESYHTMTITNFGKNQTRDLLGGVNSTYAMLYFGCSADTSSFDATWTILPSEITTNGFGRALATYVLDPSADGKWNATYTWTSTGTQSVQLYGIYCRDYATWADTLCYGEQQGAGAVKNCIAGDTLQMNATGTAG